MQRRNVAIGLTRLEDILELVSPQYYYDVKKARTIVNRRTEVLPQIQYALKSADVALDLFTIYETLVVNGVTNELTKSIFIGLILSDVIKLVSNIYIRGTLTSKLKKN